MTEAKTKKAAPKTNWSRRKTGIAHHPGTDIRLPSEPSEMPLKAARDAIELKMMEDEEIVDAYEKVEGFPFDVLVAFSLALDEIYGVSSPVTKVTQTMFGESRTPPEMISIPVSDKETIQIPSGYFKVPGVSGMLTCQPEFSSCCCYIATDQTKRKDSHHVRRIVEKTKELLISGSIYKGKAVKLHISTRSKQLDVSRPPEFLSVEGIDKEQLIYSKDLQAEIDDYLITLIENTEACEGDGIPLKRGYLLEGPYGVGKSLLGRYLSKLCSDNGWTYLLIDDATALQQALELAKKYQPAVVFCEDIDRFAAERTDAANDLLNTIDGVVGKDSQVICCLTTNHIERIKRSNQAILRPGRFDVVFSITPPDAEAVNRLIRYYAGPSLPESEDISNAANLLSGQIPAIIREAVERSKLSRIRRGDDKLSGDDLLTAAKSMNKHMQLLEELPEGQTDAEILQDQLGRAVLRKLHPDDLENGVRNIEDIYHAVV